MDHKWEEIVLLLEGTSNAAKITANILCSKVDETELSDIFHYLCTHLLLKQNWQIRVNVAYTLRQLCQKHSNILIHLLNSGFLVFSITQF